MALSTEPVARLQALPPYLFVDIDRKRRAALAAGKDVISFGVGDPDLPTHAFIIERLQQAATDPANHRYPHDVGSPAFRRAAAAFFARRYGVSLDAERELLTLIGTKEGLGHLALAVVNPGRVVLTPDPGYPVYRSATLFAGGEPVVLPLQESRDWQPDFSTIPSDVARRAALLYLNYPNNPTGAPGSKAVLADAIAFCREHDIVFCHDAAYNEMCFDEPCHSALEIPGARDVCIELHSLSKTFNMTGWRLGFAAGNADVLAALARIKANLDSGQFTAIQEAGAAALDGVERPEVLEARGTYARRARLLAEGLTQLGFRVRPPRATFYVWAGVPAGLDGMQVATRLLDEASVVCIPGLGFGEQGAGFVRFAVTVDEARIRQALDRVRSLRW